MRYYLPFSEHGDIAQLVERLNGIEKVRGSTPLISTIGFVCKIKGFRVSGLRGNRPGEGSKVGFTTLYNN